MESTPVGLSDEWEPDMQMLTVQIFARDNPHHDDEQVECVGGTVPFRK